MHPTCFKLAIADKTINFSQGCLSLEQEEFAALEAAVRRITDARPVRSPPFGFFRPPTPSPVEICIMHALGTCVQIRIACEHMRASMRIGPYAPVCACAHALACKIARARACICISRIVHHNLATHSRACTQEADSAGGDAEDGFDSDGDSSDCRALRIEAITLALPDPDQLAFHYDLGIAMDIDSAAVSPHSAISRALPGT